jgi:hypothetical protein
LTKANEAKDRLRIQTPPKEAELKEWTETLKYNDSRYKAECGPNTGNPLTCMTLMSNIRIIQQEIACVTGDSPVDALVLFGMLAELRPANNELPRSANLLA